MDYKGGVEGIGLFGFRFWAVIFAGQRLAAFYQLAPQPGLKGSDTVVNSDVIGTLPTELLGNKAFRQQ